MVQYNYSRDQLITLLRRGLSAYKNDETFVKEIVDIASYLIELKERKEKEAVSLSSSKPERVWIREATPPELSPSEKTVKKHVSKTMSDKPYKCKLCGSEVTGQIVCPRCNGIAR